MPGWNEVGFDDSGWKNAQRAQAPTGTPRICEAEPIVVAREISPVSVTMQEDGALYDFGVNTAGVCRLKIQGKAGQVLSLYHGEVLVDGRLNRRNISFTSARVTVKKSMFPPLHITDFGMYLLRV